MKPGTIGWIDITVPDAGELRDFYSAVAGWTVHSVAMDGYDDFTMLDPDGNPAAGVCHARGVNASLPPVWLIYVVVADLDRAMQSCVERGGEVVKGPLTMGNARYCIIRDPAGAHCALYMP